MSSVFSMIRLMFMLFVVSALCLSAEPDRWDWGEMEPDKEAFCDQYMPMVREIRHTQGPDAALAEFERLFGLAQEQFGSESFFYRVVWFEAQVNEGREDEEWGVTIFQYLWDRNLRTHPEYRENLPFAEYVLLRNIAEMHEGLGQVAQVRETCNQIAGYLESQQGFDMDCSGYADCGPVFSFLPDARLCEAPVYWGDLPGYESATNQVSFWYPLMYAVGIVAESSCTSGDWVNAAELSAWCIRYADEYMKGDQSMRGEVRKVLGYRSRKLLADIALLHGYPEEAARFMQEYLVRAEGYYEAEERFILLGKLNVAAIRIQTGELTEDDLAMADAAEAQVAGLKWNSRSDVLMSSLQRARIYYALGHKQKAWEIVDGLFDQAASDVNPHLQVQILGTAIDLALNDGATRPELEDWLQRALENARETGNKFEELPLYENYARFLMMTGCDTDAILIQQEAVRLARAMNLPKRLQDNRGVLEDMKARGADKQTEAVVDTGIFGSDAPSAAAPTTAEGVPPPGVDDGAPAIPAVDVQPRTSLSAALAGQPAYGRFYIHNPAVVLQQGAIRVSGSLDQLTWRNSQWLTGSASPEFDEVQREYPLSLEPGASCIVDLCALSLENGSGATVQCEWVPKDSGQAGISGVWEYQTETSGKRTTVTDAHAYQENPFYLIPIHHMIQRADAGPQEAIDFSVQSSVPMRIETYDAFSGRLLSVDANGDGDFEDRGDQIVGDANRNNWPDLVFEQGNPLASMVMYVRPAQPVAGDMELTVSICVQGEWQTDAVDVVTPSAP